MKFVVAGWGNLGTLRATSRTAQMVGGTTTEMEILHNPSETRPLEDWFWSIGIVTKNEGAWMKFYYAILAIAAATSVKLLRMMREPDIDLALANCELSNGYKHALCEFLVPRGKKPFAFCSPALAKPEGTKRMYLKSSIPRRLAHPWGTSLESRSWRRSGSLTTCFGALRAARRCR